MKNLLTLICFLSTSLWANAQQSTLYPSSMSNAQAGYVRKLETNRFSDAPLKGKRFFYDSAYHVGELRTASQHFKSEYTYRYDLWERTIQVKAADGTEILVDESDVLWSKLYLDKQIVSFVAAKVPNDKPRSILQVVYHSPTLQVLRDFHSVPKFTPHYEDGYWVAEPEITVKTEYHYFMNRGGKSKFSEVDISAKSFSKVLPEKEELIKRLFKAHGDNELTMSKLVVLLRKLDNALAEMASNK